MAEIQQSSSDDAAMPDASQSPSQTPPPLSSPHHNVVPIAVSQSHSQDSQPPATPINEYETLYTLFRTCDRSPPTDSEGFNLDIVKKQAEDYGQTWEDLDPTQKCLFAFLSMRNQVKILFKMNNNNIDAVKENVILALDPDSHERSKLEAFIRRGGDQKGSNCHQLYQNFTDNNAALTAAIKIGYSLFNEMTEGNRILRPIFRFQTANSVVCFLICAANAISYTMELRFQSSTQQKAFHQYGFNIGRYMRNKLSDDGIYNCVFAKRGGGYPVKILEDLLTHNTCDNAGKEITVEVDPSFFDIKYSISPMAVFEYIKMRLQKYGPIMFTNFRTFPAFADDQETLFCGDWSNIQNRYVPDMFHAILITGVHLLSDERYGGVLFEVQDSLPGRPFLYLGFDLLKSMGEPEMCQINEGVAFAGAQLEYAFNDDTDRQASYISGNQSPMFGQEEQKLTISTDYVHVRKQLNFTFDTRPDWVTTESPDRDYAILT